MISSMNRMINKAKLNIADTVPKQQPITTGPVQSATAATPTISVSGNTTQTSVGSTSTKTVPITSGVDAYNNALDKQKAADANAAKIDAEAKKHAQEVINQVNPYPNQTPISIPTSKCLDGDGNPVKVSSTATTDTNAPIATTVDTNQYTTLDLPVYVGKQPILSYQI